jgi:large subunit ribosomal protein L24
MGIRLKKGDTVGGEIIVEKMNIAKKHQRPTKTFQGGIIEKLIPIDPSKLMLICPKCSKPARVRFAVIDNKTTRKCAKCNEVVDKVK